MLTRRSTLATTLAAVALPQVSRARGQPLRIGYQKNGILAVAKERGAIEARLKYVIGPVTPEIVSEQQRIADSFHGPKLISRPIRIADIVWTPHRPPNGRDGSNG